MRETPIQCDARLAAPYLMSMPNVIGVCTGAEHVRGLPTGRTAIVSIVRHKMPVRALPEAARVPSEIHGHPTDVIEQTCPPLSSQAPGEQRPVRVGDGIGVEGWGAGTLGLIYRLEGQTWGLTNWHVVATTPGASPVGSYTIQPPRAGRHQRLPDGTLGPNELRIGRVERVASPMDANVDAAAFAWIDQSPTWWERYVDGMQRISATTGASWGPLCGHPVRHDMYASGQRWYDVWAGAGRLGALGCAQAKVGDQVYLPGYTTGLTTAEVYATDLAVAMDYRPHGITTLRNQIALMGDRDVVAPGDSGSTVVNAAGRVVGLVYAGQGEFAAACRIQDVLMELHGAKALRGVDIGEETGR